MAAVAQELQDQEEAGEEDEAEQADPVLDPHEDGQHHPLQRQTPSLASHQAGLLIPLCASLFLSPLPFYSDIDLSILGLIIFSERFLPIYPSSIFFKNAQRRL